MSDPRGYYEKYDVHPKEGPDKGGPYFVLAFGRDPHARNALREYARSVEPVNPTLAADLRRVLDETVLEES
jgi:hypothetical protein